MNLGEEVTLTITGTIYKIEASSTVGAWIYLKNDDATMYLNISKEELKKCQVSSS